MSKDGDSAYNYYRTLHTHITVLENGVKEILNKLSRIEEKINRMSGSRGGRGQAGSYKRPKG